MMIASSDTGFSFQQGSGFDIRQAIRNIVGYSGYIAPEHIIRFSDSDKEFAEFAVRQWADHYSGNISIHR